MRDRFNAAAGRTRAAVWALVLALAALSFAAAPAGAASPNTEGPMYAIEIQGKGPYSTGSQGSSADADVHAQRLVETLAQQGHEITRADFVVHGRALELRGRTMPTAPVASERVVVGLDVAVDSVEGLRAVVDTLRIDRDTALSDCSTAVDDRLYECRSIAIASLEAALRAASSADRVVVGDSVVEAVAAHMHESWRAAKSAAGVTSRLDATTGEELMRPYGELSPMAKGANRAQVLTVLDSLGAAGFVAGRVDEWGQATAKYAAASERIETLDAERDAWEQTAAQENRNVEYFRGLVDTIGAHFGEAARTADDGSVGDSILRAKVPELVAAALQERDELRVENARLVEESAAIARELTALRGTKPADAPAGHEAVGTAFPVAERPDVAASRAPRPRRSGAAT